MNRLALDDAAVIEVSRAEPDRFASLFDRHAPYIHRYLARRVGTQAADDLVAETFLGRSGGLALLRQQGDEHLRSAHLRLPGHDHLG